MTKAPLAKQQFIYGQEVTMPGQTMTYDEYAKPPIFRRVQDIQGYSLNVSIPSLARAIPETSGDIIISGLYEESRKVIKLAKFFYDYELRLVHEPTRLGVVF